MTIVLLSCSFFFFQSAIGIIIGKGGENIKAMSSMSLAKISVASSANYDTSKFKILNHSLDL